MEPFSPCSVFRSLAVACLVAAGCAQAQPAGSGAPAPRAERPSLVVVLTVDQLAPMYLERWRGQLTGGFARLLNEGAVFTRAYHDHAITETAPGHAAILSGRFPYSTGITANLAGVNTEPSPLLGAPEVGANPARFQGTTLVDWMKAADPALRVLSVSRKDRGAILPVGRGKYPVFWYAQSAGRFTTSTWYADTLPAWVRAFNAEEPAMRYAGRAWDLLLPDSAYAEPDTVPAESIGEGFVFPYRMPGDTLRARNLLISFPFMDELTLDFAWRGVRAMQLGQRDRPDLLAVSLSTTDAVGHRWGPESREMHDHILRLDRALGAFLDSLTALVGAERLAVVLTSDHGIGPSPDVRSVHQDNTRARRVMIEEFEAAVMTAARTAADRKFPLDALDFDGFTLTVNRSLLDRRRDPDIRAIAQVFARAARGVRGVQRVDVLEDLTRADTTRDAIARRWLHMFRPGGDVAAVVTLEPFHIFGRSNMATHGSPHDYDAHVPLIFWGGAFRAMRDETVVRVVDIAPTLAAVLGVRVGERVDGRPLRPVVPASP